MNLNENDLRDLHRNENWLRSVDTAKPSRDSVRRTHDAIHAALSAQRQSRARRWNIAPAWGAWAAAAMLLMSVAVIQWRQSVWSPQQWVDPLNQLAAVVEPVESVDAPYVQLMSAFETEYASTSSNVTITTAPAVSDGSASEYKLTSLEVLEQDVEQLEWELASGWEI